MSITVAAVGDCIITRSLREQTAAEFLRLRDIVREADCAFANLEIMPHRYEGPPSVESGGAWLCCDPALVDDLRWLGFHMFACANNHTLDWGREGLIAAIRHLDLMRVAYAGIGHNLAQARAPRYVETARGRVALIAAASTFTTEAPAGAQSTAVPGRPGLNPLRYQRVFRVSERDRDALQDLARRVGDAAARERRTRDGWQDPDPEGHFTVFDHQFTVGEPIGEFTEPDPRDLEGNLRAIHEAQRQADWVLVSLHTHESLPGTPEKPAMFAQTFARACIDAGAHAVLGHGPHLLRGIEMYRGRPIVYSLGNFIFGSELMTAQPADHYERWHVPIDGGPADIFDARTQRDTRGFSVDSVYWETIIARLELRDDGRGAVEVVPVTLGYREPRPSRGTPRMAGPDQAKEIVARLDALSRPYGTAIREDGERWRVTSVSR